MRVASRTGGLAAMCLTVLGLALGPLAGTAVGEAGPSAAVRLERTYSPIVALDAQTRACGPGEAYRPTVVDLVLGNREVVLRNARGRVVARAPTARDLSDAPSSDYLDLPGNPLRPGCHYERQFRRWYGDRSPSVYAHIATDSEHPRQAGRRVLVLLHVQPLHQPGDGGWVISGRGRSCATTSSLVAGSGSRGSSCPTGSGDTCAPKGSLCANVPGRPASTTCR